MTKRKSVLINPNSYDYSMFDERTKQVFADTIAFMEKKGRAEISSDILQKVWQHDFIEYQAEHGIYATLLTAEGYGDDPDARFDLFRVCPFSELLGFYSGGYQYCYQVSILGVSPVWMGDNEEQKHDLARLLKEGNVFAFGMSEKKPGADLYSNEANLRPVGDGTYVANGEKYYIGNSNVAPKIPTLGKNLETGQWCFWVVDRNNRHYKYVRDINTKSDGIVTLGTYEMVEYPITKAEILKEGDGAFADGLSTINIGKFTCGWSSVGIVTHALYEAVTHANRRILFGHRVTEIFPHIRSFLSEAYVRANAMRLYCLRATDYFRMMSPDDRRYLLFNPIVKNKVTREGDKVMSLIMDVVCAKGYEADTYMSEAMISAGMYTRLEGTAHVNMALVMKFMKNYFFSEKEYPEFGIVSEPKNDSNIFAQTMGGLSKIEFPDYGKAYEGVNIPNVKLFKQQVDLFRELLMVGAPEAPLMKNMDYMLNWGEIFCNIVYAQLILEATKLYNVEDELVDQIFAHFIRDTAKFALAQVSSHDNTDIQNEYFWNIIKVVPVVDKEKELRFWKEYVEVLDGVYMPKGNVVGLDHLND
ncbi:MAG: acyl-CoA dehydrogenase [Clostridiales bacterium]|nr:acyl-CoA dehydrogenase [Clostridiales bacterium]